MSNFKISGLNVTSTSRDMVLDGNWEDGLNYLLESFEGMSYEYAIEILSGIAFIDDDLELIYIKDLDKNSPFIEPTNTYIEKVNDLYYGYIRENGTWYKGVSYHDTNFQDDYYLLRRDYLIQPSFIYFNTVQLGYQCAMIHKKDNEIIKMVKEYSFSDVDSSYWYKDSIYVYFEVAGNTPPIWLQSNLKKNIKLKSINIQKMNLLPRGNDNHISNSYPSNIDFKATVDEPLKKDFIEANKTIVDDTISFDNKKFENLKNIISEKNLPFGVFDIYYKNKVYFIPRMPFLHWIYSTFKNYKKPDYLKDWNFVSNPNMKMDNDNQYHTDWMIGADIPFELYYNDMVFRDLILDLVQKSLNNTKDNQVFVINQTSSKFIVTKIVNKEPALGESIILNNASMENYDLVKNSSCIIAKQGGTLSHLSINATENSIPFVIIPNENINEGDTLFIDLEQGVFYKKEEVGNKAFNLLIADKIVNVPSFEIVDSNNNDVFLTTDTYIVRSTMLDEDSTNTSNAGQYNSDMFVTQENLSKSISKIANEKNKAIIQCMINADFSGVAFYKKGILTLNYAKGLNEVVTNGLSDVSSFSYDGKNITTDFKEQTKIYTFDGLEDCSFNAIIDDYESKIIAVYKAIVNIKTYLSSVNMDFNLDIEFCFKDNKLYILQFRPLI